MNANVVQRLGSLRHTKRIFPFLEWLPELRYWSTLRADIIAGITVAMLLIPQSMAYAHLAGLPVHIGLYAAFIPPIVAALFGSSRTLSTGPVPVTSLLTAVALQPLVAIGTPEYLSFVFLLTFLAGAIQLGLGFLRFGVVVNFISYPVLLGLINAVAIIIACMQINNIFGVYAAPDAHLYLMVWQVLTDAINNPNWPTVGIAVLAFIIILGGRWLRPHWPHIFFAVVITTLVAWISGYEMMQTISVKQIINPSIQQMMENYQTYPQALEKQIKKVEQAEKTLAEAIKKAGLPAEEVDKAISESAQEKLQLERLIMRHNIEIAELNRLRLKRMKTQTNQTVFYADQQMSPIGEVDPNEWRINKLPDKGLLKIQAGGEVVGEVRQGLPAFNLINFSWQAISDLFIAALVIALVGFTEAITIAKRIATESRQQLNTNQELVSQGLAKCVGGFFQSMPVSGSFTRTTLNYQTGAKTGFSTVMAGVVVMIVLLWLTPLFYYLPYATLGVIIMIGVLSLLDVKEMWRVWQISRNEGIIALSTFFMALAFAPHIALAIVLGILLSLGFYLHETMQPRLGELTRDENGELTEISGEEIDETCYLISMLRYHGSLYFANAAYFENKIVTLINKKQKLRYIILDCISINQMDATGVETLRSVCSRLEDAGIELWFTRMRRTVMSVLEEGGLAQKLGPHHFYKDNEVAIAKLADNLGAKHMKTCPLAIRPIAKQ